ncbi:DNA helicase PIF1/RRM3 [Trachipleistophora hominis]|uniref:DNA helicase PIF1/RRM3 n=1 Tax=Trachipleistophora hominis TaxID=72359 RepID=L7JRY9_TRAHO|nr:DNA helicase PIF1/RRM3 [Trachipleistophora hominis]
MRDVNPYAEAFKNLAEVERNALQEGTTLMDLNMVFNANIHRNMNRYNVPRASEIAMIFNDRNGEPPFARDVKVYARNANYDNITLSILSPHLDPMTYALLYPYGEPGWTRDLVSQGNNVRCRISMLQFKVAQLAIRQNVFNPHLHAGKLLQQWIVDEV